ncbi:hypothetical protein D9758_019070, partial [Tetrapyrgos nigripes]
LPTTCPSAISPLPSTLETPPLDATHSKDEILTGELGF